jgi:hypothetical protein
MVLDGHARPFVFLSTNSEWFQNSVENNCIYNSIKTVKYLQKNLACQNLYPKECKTVLEEIKVDLTLGGKTSQVGE